MIVGMVVVLVFVVFDERQASSEPDSLAVLRVQV
jgi:hypothetical protein